ncbi:MAG: sodium/solute symporter [Kiritimatiellae bacterium]|nr:sodium/solute symporter [Kiritimatiellia bacterium]
MIKKNWSVIPLLFGLLIASTGLSQEARQSHFLEWSELPPLPPLGTNTLNPGVAGAYAGVYSNHLIVAGGANFPLPVTDLTNGAAKIYHDAIYCMAENNGTYAYMPNIGALPFPLAYGASVTIPQGVLLIGGHNTDGAVADVLLLTFEQGQFVITALPSLPGAVTCSGAVRLGDKVYLAGGSRSESAGDAMRGLWGFNLNQLAAEGFIEKSAIATTLLSMDMLQLETEARGSNIALTEGETRAELRARLNRALWNNASAWDALPEIPGEPRCHLMVSAQHDGYTEHIYIMGGRYALTASEQAALSEAERRTLVGSNLRFLDEVLKYNPYEQGWKHCAPMPTPLSAGSVISSGQGHIFVLSGSDGSHVAQWESQKFLYAHPGFVPNPYIYHAITDTWVVENAIPGSEITAAAMAAQLGMEALPPGYPTPSAQVTAAITGWGNDIILVSGEVRPGVRTPALRRIALKPVRAAFGLINYSTLIIYLLAMVGIGVYFARKNKSTDDFFRGGQNIPWWAAACSIYATMLSSITFVALPAKAFATDWTTWIMQITILPVSLFVIWKILPFFRQIDATSAYEYLEKRFNYTARVVGSALFVLFQLGRMAVVMYLPALALQAITGLDPILCILIMGVLSVIYCTMGGIEAVIWTDTIQTFVLLGGALASVGIILLSIDGGWSTFLNDCASAGKFKVINWDFSSGSYMTMTLWVVLLGGIFQNLSSYSADQAVVQRYMTTPSLKKAANSILMNGIMCVPASLIFFAVGAALFSFYKNNPAEMIPTFEPKAVFPLFIATKMPVGIAGLVVAGIFAAAQSTLSTSMNSLSTALVTDFAQPMRLCKTDQGYLTLARVLTALVGTAGTLSAVVIARSNIFDVFDQYIVILGLFMGVLGGMFILGMFSGQANSAGCIIAAVICATFMCWLKFYSGSPIHGFLYPAVSLTMTYTLGILISLATGGNRKKIDGLTVFSGHSKRVSEK